MGDVFVKNGDFVALPTVGESFTRFMPADFLLNDVVVFLSKLMHPLLECFDIFPWLTCGQDQRRNKTVVNNRADCHFGMRPKLFNRVP